MNISTEISLIDLYKQESSNVFTKLDNDSILKLVDLAYNCYLREGTIFVAGNGGTTGFLQNFSVDLNMHTFVSEDKSQLSEIKRNKFKCINLCAEQSTITGISNDLGFNHIYESQLLYQASNDDLFIGMSGSGNSPNIVQAMKYCRKIGVSTILITRNKNSLAKDLCDLFLFIDGISNFPGQTGSNNNNFHFEDILSKLTHITCGLLKTRIGNA